MLSKFNGTPTPKWSYRAKTGDNDCNINSGHYSLRTALCESIRYQAKSEQNVRQDLIPRVRHGEAALCTHGIYCYRFVLQVQVDSGSFKIFDKLIWTTVDCKMKGAKMGF